MKSRFLPDLVDLGLTEQEAKIYLTLLEEGNLPAREIAEMIDILPSAVYRTAKRLEDKKLIGIIKSSPILYQAVSPEVGLNLFIKQKRINLERRASEISNGLGKRRTSEKSTKVDVITGRYETFMVGREMVDLARKQLLIISIGENIPRKLMLSMNRANRRGVELKMIAHKYDKENVDILKNFKRNGYKIRHYPDWGFHLVICDKKQILLIVNNPDDPAERVGLKMHSKGMVKAMREYFFSTWEKAVKV